jgi:hypothetical protein
MSIVAQRFVPNLRAIFGLTRTFRAEVAMNALILGRIGAFFRAISRLARKIGANLVRFDQELVRIEPNFGANLCLARKIEAILSGMHPISNLNSVV